MAQAEHIEVTVVYCRANRQWERPVRVPTGASLAQAVAASGLLHEAAELRDRPLDLGVYNHRRPAHTVAQAGDRIEIYRPLQIEPMAARRLRAELRRKPRK